MPDRQPTDTRNLDIYGNAALEWSRALKALAVPPDDNLTWFLGTVRPDIGLTPRASAPNRWIATFGS